MTTPIPSPPTAQGRPNSVFATTHWSVVLSARDKESPESSESLEKLCRTYWYPLYAYARWQGRQPHDAEDLTQEFFARLLQKDYLGAVEPARGRFRTFLLVAFKRFLSDEYDKNRAQKRGGGTVAVTLDTGLAERLYQNEPPSQSPADRLYERRWALTLLEQSMSRLRAEFETEGKIEEFERFKQFVGSSRVDLQACKLEYSIVSPK